MAELAPQARAALRARITLPPLPTRAHRLIHCASRIMAGVKSTFVDECWGFEAVQAVQWASSGELGAVDGRHGLLLERGPCGSYSTVVEGGQERWNEERRSSREGRAGAWGASPVVYPWD